MVFTIIKSILERKKGQYHLPTFFPTKLVVFQSNHMQLFHYAVERMLSYHTFSLFPNMFVELQYHMQLNTSNLLGAAAQLYSKTQLVLRSKVPLCKAVKLSSHWLYLQNRSCQMTAGANSFQCCFPRHRANLIFNAQSPIYGMSSFVSAAKY